ncbi:MAG: hypothetical protein KKF62_07255 [Bacteroidetes bacterium]|nr:hypothetical protein [Bacteroidota bacterium]MBU1114141.1 hypothetical protein [Bacteroidota bacterium]MBU1796807.1 hypothetical protein [Bacteroidota bacterium]
MKLWKENNITEIQKLLNFLLSIWQENGGYSFTAKNTFAFNEFLCSIKTKEFVRSAAHKAITEMRSTSKNTPEEFCEIYNRIKKELSKKKSLQNKFTFYIPLEAEFEGSIDFPISITLLGNKFQFVRNIPFSKKLLSSLPMRLLEYQGKVKEHISDKNRIFLSIVGHGKDWDEAWENITLSFDVLRGIIEFSFSFRGFQMSSHSKPRSKIPHPKWVIIRNHNNEFDGTTFNVQDYKLISKFKFTPKHIKVMKNNTRVLQNKPKINSSKQLLVSCMRLYSDAMDGYYRYNQFLGLWTIAEAICLSEDFGGESKKVSKRLAWFGQDIGLVATGYTNILDSLSYKRNDLVHKGISEIYDDDINHLKYAIDTALLWLYRSVSKFKTIQHLLQYYRLKDLSNTELTAIDETISIINKER